VEEGIVYLLDPVPDESGLPQLSMLDEEGELNLVEFSVSEEINPEAEEGSQISIEEARQTKMISAFSSLKTTSTLVFPS